MSMRWMMSLLAALMLLLPCTGVAEDFADSFPGVFLQEGEAPVQTENSYTSQNIHFEISTMRVEKSDVYVVDIYVRSLEHLQRYYGGGAWKTKTVRMSTLSEESGAVLAITGDSSQNFVAGWSIGNGKVWRDTPNRKRDLCILYNSGEMVMVQSEDMNHDAIAAQTDSIWHTFLFGPILLDTEGRALTDFSESNVERINPRSVIGYYEPGHYCFVQVDGRDTKSKLEDGKRNRGLTLNELAELMESLGCTNAYNLDGGRSSMLWYNGEVISKPAAADRRIGDIILLKELE